MTIPTTSKVIENDSFGNTSPSFELLMYDSSGNLVDPSTISSGSGYNFRARAIGNICPNNSAYQVVEIFNVSSSLLGYARDASCGTFTIAGGNFSVNSSNWYVTVAPLDTQTWNPDMGSAKCIGPSQLAPCI
ncbi:hypothetical protein AWW68_11040 [Roseivirga spongicola]|uniref:Uncharacterized protein n=2 Tax=Roseivirga spongicola TaxID=333140 RepID=A0A150X9G2_9BACT|nr:hypothetical protein AWW68_11040 [Roseivirga spongicola]